MEAKAQDKLHSLLFEEGRELVNIKFFPGTDRGLTLARMRDAAHRAIESALKSGPINSPPSCGREPQTLEEFVTAS